MIRALLLSLIALYGCTRSLPEMDFTPRQQADARIELGIAYLQRGYYPKAYESLSTALEVDPNYYRAQLAMARYLDIVGEMTKAKRLYQYTLRTHPDNGNVLNNYGTFLCRQGKYQQALALLLQATRLQDYYAIAESYENAGLCALKAGSSDQAWNYFERALQHQPNRTSTLIYLADLESEE